MTGVAITSDPGDGGSYVQGDTVLVTVSFSEPVDVAGAPRLEIDLGRYLDKYRRYGFKRWANYTRGAGTTALTGA